MRNLITSLITEPNVSKVSPLDIADIINKKSRHHANTLIISTLNIEYEHFVIQGTVPIQEEADLINKLISKKSFETKIIIYGKNSSDERIYEKYNQLVKHGFTYCSVYVGGLFEWLLLQEVCGREEFPTKTECVHVLMDIFPPRILPDNYL